MIDEIIKQLQPKINGTLIYLSQYGSHLYGLNTENSDLDFRGVYIPTLDDIILKKDKDEINEELTILNTCQLYKFLEDKSMDSFQPKMIKVDVKIFSLQKFIQLCSKADTNALDLLFSISNDNIEKYRYMETIEGAHKATIRHIYENRNKLINTDRLESPITYAFKQATKFGIKGCRLKALEYVLEKAKELSLKPCNLTTHTVQELIQYLELDDKHLKIDILDNKGTPEHYLFVCGVEHQFNVDLDRFIDRIQEKIDKEYTSQRTKDAKDGNDWKALSHAIRVLLEIKELLDTSNIQFPLKNKQLLLDMKLGKLSREEIDSYFENELSKILERIQNNELNWKYDEQFWNEFILKEYRNVN